MWKVYHWTDVKIVLRPTTVCLGAHHINGNEARVFADNDALARARVRQEGLEIYCRPFRLVPYLSPTT